MSTFGALFIFVMLIGVYFVPTIVAADRKVPNVWSVAVINVFLGWTLVGWVVALALAVRDREDAVRAPVADSGDVEGLRQLADLHSRGVLTDDEFAFAKDRALRPRSDQ